jgi:hypothetical protein
VTGKPTVVPSPKSFWEVMSAFGNGFWRDDGTIQKSTVETGNSLTTMLVGENAIFGPTERTARAKHLYAISN